MTKSAPSKSFEVFEFNEPDEFSEIVARKFTGKFSNPRGGSPSKYAIPRLVSRGINHEAMEFGQSPHPDIDPAGSDARGDYDSRHPNSTKGEGNLHCGTDARKPDIVLSGTDGKDPGPELPMTGIDASADCPSSSNSSGDGHNHHIGNDEQTSIGIFVGPEKRDSCSGRLNCSILESPSSNESNETFTNDADESMRETSSLTPTTDNAYDSDGIAAEDRFGGWDVENNDKAVYFCPDYVTFRDEYCTASLLAFTSSCIKLKRSIGSCGTCDFQWDVDDLIGIKSQWFGEVETAQAILSIISKDVPAADNAHGIEQLKFAVVDPVWSNKLEEIKSLNVKYKAVWDVELDGGDENSMLRLNGDCSQRHYFPSFDEHFEEVVYPEGDTDAVSISKRDIDLLQPDTFINDTIIDFYIKYLKNKIHPVEKHRFHFFNSFFFRKLADLDKDPSSASNGRAAFLRVRKWTRKVNLFEKDYTFIPVNFSLHWSLIVICHAGELMNFEDDDIHKSVKVPCILHMDSIKGSHAGLEDIIQRYLWEEWKEKHKETSEVLSSKFFNLRFVSLELPQQENMFDCGLFLLHYAERFLEDAPVNFNPFKLSQFSNFLSASWFPPSEVSLKRSLIQRLIYKLLENHSKGTVGNCIDEQQPTFTRNFDNETCVELVGEGFSPAKGNLLASLDGQGIEITLLTAPPLRSAHCVSDSGIVLRELFDPGATTGSFLGRSKSFERMTSFCSGTMSPIMEEVEGDQQLVYSTPGEARHGQPGETGKDPGAGNCWDPGLSMETLNGAFEGSLEIGSGKTISGRDSLGLGPDQCRNDKVELSGSPSPSNNAGSTEHLMSGSGRLEEGVGHCCAEEREGVTVALDEQHGAKRLRLMLCPDDGERMLARSISNDLHL